MEPFVVPSFGGGLNFTKHSTELDPSEWTWADGWVAKDGYAEVLPGYERTHSVSYVGDPLPTGLIQNPFGWDVTAGAVLIAMVNTSDGDNRLLRVNGTGAATEITWDAAGTQPSGDAFNCVTVGAFINGFLVLNFGVGPTAVSMIRWGGGANFTGLSQAPKAYYLASHAGHLVAAGGALTQAGIRTLAISDADSEATWIASVANSADSATLDDLRSGINGLALVGDNLGVFTRGIIFRLASTGSIPPFTRHVLQRRGALDRFRDEAAAWFPLGPMIGETPRGTIFLGTDDFYAAESGEGIGAKVFDYWRFKDLSSSGTPMPQLQWHETRGVLYVPVTPPDGGGAHEVLMLDPKTGAWSRRTFAVGRTPLRHACLWDWTNTDKPAHLHHFVEELGQIDLYRERTDGAAQGGEFVHTKDFRLPDPIAEAEVFKLKLDWEPLTNAATDAIEVLAYWRPDYAPPGIMGTAGKHLDLSGLMVSQGTLTGGASELDVRGAGKLLRLGFRRSSGRARIRGFSFHYEGDGSERKAA